MPKYLLRGQYTPEGLKGVRADGAAARETVTRAAIESIGGNIEAYYCRPAR
jgi:uncharacterized protein with GYD domain